MPGTPCWPVVNCHVDARANRDEEVADLEAFQRQYEDDQSWTALQEDEYGRLRPLVSAMHPGLAMTFRPASVCSTAGLTEWYTTVTRLLMLYFQGTFPFWVPFWLLAHLERQI